MASRADPPLCPSSRPSTSSLVLGIVRGDGTIAYLGDPPTADAEFLERAEAGRDPRKRFRFAAPCQTDGCAHWRSGACSVVTRVVDHVGEVTQGQELPACGIRSRCRWFSQAGVSACRACSWVVTDLSESVAWRRTYGDEAGIPRE